MCVCVCEREIKRDIFKLLRGGQRITFGRWFRWFLGIELWSSGLLGKMSLLTDPDSAFVLFCFPLKTGSHVVWADLELGYVAGMQHYTQSPQCQELHPGLPAFKAGTVHLLF